MKRISAIIPVYNGEATVARAIDSALAQRFDGQLEIVVTNDGSTDSTSAILESYGSRINVAAQPNRGPAAARNRAVAASRGEYLAFLDADDYWLPGHLAKTCDALERNPRAVLAFCDGFLIDENGRQHQWGGRPCPPRLSMRAGTAPTLDDLLRAPWQFLTDAVVMRRSAFEACGGFCEKFRAMGGEDLYLWLCARELGEFEYVPEPLAVYNMLPLPLRAAKYERGHRTLLKLVRQRYGAAAKPLIDRVTSYFAPALLVRALQQVDSGDRRGAAQTFIALMSMRPSYLFDLRLAVRALRPKNLHRLIRVVAGA
jgi:glycosyltransferase involved in cell wall biosynthesis